MRGYLESGQVGDPCVHVVCPFTTYKLIPNNLILSILLHYMILTFCTVYFFIDTN